MRGCLTMHTASTLSEGRWAQRRIRPAARARYLPAGHCTHANDAKSGAWVAGGQGARTPPTQNSPGEHGAAPDRASGSVPAASGVEYHPGGTGVGSPDPAGQCTATPPQGTGFGVVDRAAHT